MLCKICVPHAILSVQSRYPALEQKKETHLLYPTTVVSYTRVTLEYVEPLSSKFVAVCVRSVYPLTRSIRKDVLVGT